MATIKVRWTVEELDNVMTLYDVQKVYRKTDITLPSWTEITTALTRVDLVAATTSYYFDDTTGDDSYFYAMTYYNSTSGAESDFSDPISGDVSDIQYMEIQDLYNLVGAGRVVQYFDDDLDGSIDDDNLAVQAVLAGAEAEAASRLLRSWSIDEITELADNDRAFRNHVAWVALELASERRPEFAASDGKGAFWTQYERAITYFENVSKSILRSAGESEAGINPQTQGNRAPAPVSTDSPRFVFAPGKNYPTGHGGF